MGSPFWITAFVGYSKRLVSNEDVVQVVLPQFEGANLHVGRDSDLHICLNDEVLAFHDYSILNSAFPR